jgi:hypothetical protein
MSAPTILNGVKIMNIPLAKQFLSQDDEEIVLAAHSIYDDDVEKEAITRLTEHGFIKQKNDFLIWTKRGLTAQSSLRDKKLIHFPISQRNPLHYMSGCTTNFGDEYLREIGKRDIAIIGAIYLRQKFDYSGTFRWTVHENMHILLKMSRFQESVFLSTESIAMILLNIPIQPHQRSQGGQVWHEVEPQLPAIHGHLFYIHEGLHLNFIGKRLEFHVDTRITHHWENIMSSVEMFQWYAKGNKLYLGEAVRLGNGELRFTGDVYKCEFPNYPAIDKYLSELNGEIGIIRFNHVGKANKPTFRKEWE